MTFFFAQGSREEAREPFVSTDSGGTWHVRHSALDGQDAASPYLSVALPIGDNAEGTWLVPLEPGGVLPLLGEAAPALLARGPDGRRLLGLVGDDPGLGGPRRPQTPRRGCGRSVGGAAHPVLWGSGSLPPGRPGAAR